MKGNSPGLRRVAGIHDGVSATAPCLPLGGLVGQNSPGGPEVDIVFLVGGRITVAYLSTRMTVMHMAKQPFGHAELLLPIVLQCACVVNTYWQVLDLPR